MRKAAVTAAARTAAEAAEVDEGPPAAIVFDLFFCLGVTSLASITGVASASHPLERTQSTEEEKRERERLRETERLREREGKHKGEQHRPVLSERKHDLAQESLEKETLY